MIKIHFCYKKIGGVGSILNKLIENSEFVIEYNLLKLIKYIKENKINKIEIYLHQPRAHFFASLIKLVLKILNAKNAILIIVLHESADYNVDLSRKQLFSRFKYIIRKLNIYISGKLNIKFLAVSNYVAKSYKLKEFKLISYLHLFERDFRFRNKHKNKGGCIVWLREGTAYKSLEIVKKLYRNSYENEFYIIGKMEECHLFNYILKNDEICKSDIKIKNHFGNVSKNELDLMLLKLKWLISLYEKEGFGLLVFESLLNGVLVICYKSGALVEYVPEINFKLIDLINNNNLDNNLIEYIAKHNKKMAHNKLIRSF